MNTQLKRFAPTAAAISFALQLLVSSAAVARPVAGTTRTSVNRGQGASANAGRNANAGQNANVNRNANVNQNANVNRNVNVNQNVNVHRDIDVDVDRGFYHPVATAAAVTATAAITAAAIGSVVASLPPSCTQVMRGNAVYQQCGSTWYQPQYSGTQMSYVVVSAP